MTHIHGATASTSGNYAGPAWLVVSVIGAVLFFGEGLSALLAAWSTPEYSHGPLIPVLSGILFLRQLKSEPIQSGSANRLPGVAVFLVALLIAALGKLANIPDVVAYATILWVGAVLLMSFGWAQGKRFWPAVLHLVYMLPLPGIFYYKLSTYLQTISSELGVWMLQLLSVPVFLEGNIIELDTIKLHVAEACSGMRYLFPIMSFSYVFAVLYRGPTWHKAVLLLAAAPISVVMNSVRIALAGLLVKHWGAEHLEGFSHFFEGWVIFLASVLLLLFLAQILIWSRRDSPAFFDVFDLEFDGLWQQAKRVRLMQASRALITTTSVLFIASALWVARPAVHTELPNREPFAFFPLTLGDWTSAAATSRFSDAVETSLGADDYMRKVFTHSDGEIAEVFTAYYEDQTKGGTHSPEICLPASGWEIASIERVNVAVDLNAQHPFNINRAIIQKGEARMLAYYWFEQHGRHVAWDFEAKLMLLWDGVLLGRTDGALVRLITPIGEHESEQSAEMRLMDLLAETTKQLPRFVPEDSRLTTR